MGNSNMNPQQNSKNNHSSTVKNCAKSLNENTPVINLQVATSEMEAEENNTSTTKRRKRQTTKRKNNELEMDNVLSSTPRLRTRNDYAKLSKSELNKLADRIQSVIEQVDSEPNTKTINPCANKYKKRKKSDTVRGEQIPGTSFGAGAIGTVSTSFNRYGVSPCVCCNNIDLTCDKHLQGPCNTESRISLGYNGMIKKMSPNTAYRFKKDQERSLHQESKLLLQEESPVLLHQQHLMYMNESTNYEHSSLTQDKLDFIQKFMDSMAADRIDYEKPQQLNIIQGIDPILFDSETKETRLSTHLQDSRTIVQRVNYKKKRSSKISSLPQNKFSFNEVAAMSTPNVKTMRSTSIANIIAVINEVATMSTTNFESVGNEVASTSTSRVEADVNEVANIPTTDFEAVVNEVADTSTSRADVDSDEVTNMLTPDVIALARTSTFRVEADINEVATMSTPNVNEVAGTSTFRAEADINGAATMSTPNVEAVPATSSSSVAADINVVTARPTSNVEVVVIDDVTTKSSRNFRVINEEPLLINDDNLSNQTITYDTELNKENNRTGCLNINLSFVTMRKHPKVKIEVSSSIEQNNHVNSTNVNCSTNQPCATNNTPRLSGMLSSEAEVMDLVDNLLGDDRHNIDHQANRRFEMMMRADVIACNDSNIIDLDVLDDGIHDFMNHDQSVILIEDSDHNDSVQVVENCENRRSKRNKCKNTKTTVQAAETKEENPKVESLEIDTASSNNAISRSCPVCLEYLDSKPVSATTCGHVFCTACITQSIKTNRKCPNCRMGLTLKKIHPLYLN